MILTMFMIYSCIVTSAIDYLFLDMGTLWVDYCSVATFQDFWGSVYDSGEDCHCMVFVSCATATCSSCGPAATLRTLGYPVRTSMSPERYPSKRLIWDGPRAKPCGQGGKVLSIPWGLFSHVKANIFCLVIQSWLVVWKSNEPQVTGLAEMKSCRPQCRFFLAGHIAAMICYVPKVSKGAKCVQQKKMIAAL